MHNGQATVWATVRTGVLVVLVGEEWLVVYMSGKFSEKPVNHENTQMAPFYPPGMHFKLLQVS